MDGYFSFLKNSGKHLDDKTKAIISVITKVDKQTASGFRQYLKRALSKGVTANEVIDALFVAFPTLGLSKIVWAIDILLEMNLSEFTPENMKTVPSWHQLINNKDLKAGVTSIKGSDGTNLLAYKENEEIKIYDAHCPHESTLMSEEDSQGTKITCPLHKWEFDMCSGECIGIGNRSMKMYESKVEDDLVLAYW